MKSSGISNRSAAIEIIHRLRGEGFEALLAGGCVRDMLLGRRAKDYDVVTSAHPEQITGLFRRTIQIGAKFGVVMVLIGKQQVEVATFRTESGYADGRHPDQVRFSGAAQDASRRDFTVNGMFYDPIQKKLLDFVGGRKDLRQKILRTIGLPDRRLEEDFLRMLRAVRFATQLDFTIEEHTWKAVKRHADKITRISGERIAAEIEVILTHPARGNGSRLFLESGLCKAVFPGLSLEGGTGVLACLKRPIGFPLALAALFADCQAESALAACDILKLSREHTRHLTWLLDHRWRLMDPDIGLAPLKRMLISPYFRDVFDLHKARAGAENLSLRPLNILRRRIHALRGIDLAPRPLLNGHQLIALGTSPGPMVGLVAEDLYVAQLSEQIHSIQEAEKFVRGWLDRHSKTTDS